MTSDTNENEQQRLVSVLYSVHDKLRLTKSKSKNDQEWEQAWRKHTSDIQTLKEYSKAMHDLATQIWEPKNSTITNDDAHPTPSDRKPVKLKCRLEWVVQSCETYYKDRAQDSGKKLKLLDVGSCYNPFSKYVDYFDVVAMDLCPAPGFEDQVYRCDFLEVNLSGSVSEDEESVVRSDVSSNSPLSTITSYKVENYNNVTACPTNFFDVVVFSYFLEYLADESQRVKSCKKAYRLLRQNGLLFILRPDSSRVTPGGNNVLMKKMKVGMALLGFKRIYFEKLEHLWCMAFKKLSEVERVKLVHSPYFVKDVKKVGAEFAVEEPNRIHELFCISQDFKHRLETDSTSNIKDDNFGSPVVNVSECDPTLLLQELPNFED